LVSPGSISKKGPARIYFISLKIKKKRKKRHPDKKEEDDGIKYCTPQSHL